MPVPFVLVRMAVHTGVAKWLPAVRRRLGPMARSLHYLSDRTLATPLHQVDDCIRRQCAVDGRVIDLSTLPAWTVSARPSPAMRHDCDVPAAGLPVLRQRVCDGLTSATGITFESEDETLIIAGGRCAIHVIADTFLNPRDRVVLFDPGSPLFVDAVRHRRAVIRWMPTEIFDNRLHVPDDGMRKALTGAKMVFMSQPAGPTGCAWSDGTLEALTRWANRYDLLIVWDRSLTRWSCEPLPSEFPWLTALRNRVLVVQRIAAGVAAIVGPTGLVKPCCLTAQQTTAPPPSALQQLAIAQAGDFEDTATRDSRTAARDDICQRLTALGLTCARPSCGPFAWIDVSATRFSGRQFSERLAKEGVVVLPGDRCGPNGKDYVRITWAGDEGRWREGLRRFEDLVRQIGICKPVVNYETATDNDSSDLPESKS